MTEPSTLAEHRAALEALGTDIVPDMIAGSIALTAPHIDAAIYEGVTVEADLAYGTHDRQVLDVYSNGTTTGAKPVLVYVHGGGFTMGAKSSEQTPFFRNLGAWAVQQGWVAVVINYRLAPEFTFPSGAEDIAAAITWIVEHIASYGGDPGRIFLSGQSAGAMHVADYVVGHGGYGPHGRALRGAVLVSPLVDIDRAARSGRYTVYWGDDESRWPSQSTLPGLLETDLPLLVTVSEYDESQFQLQAAQFTAAWAERHGTFPPLHRLDTQNHLTSVYAIGTPWDSLGPLLGRFVASYP